MRYLIILLLFVVGCTSEPSEAYKTSLVRAGQAYSTEFAPTGAKDIKLIEHKSSVGGYHITYTTFTLEIEGKTHKFLMVISENNRGNVVSITRLE